MDTKGSFHLPELAGQINQFGNEMRHFKGISKSMLHRPLSLGGHVESRGNKRLCFRTASLGQTRIQCEASRAKTKLFILLRLNLAAE